MTNEIKGGDTLELSSDINVITAEINAYQRVAGEAIFEIGRRLKHVKENDLAHGEFGKWLETVSMKPRQAQRFIKVFERFGKATPVTYFELGMSVLYELADFTDEELDQTYELPSGESKKPTEMSRREIETLKAEIKKEREAKEQAERQADIERSQRERLEEEVEHLSEREPETVTEYIEVTPEDYEQLKKEREEYARKLEESGVYSDEPYGVKLGMAMYGAFEELSKWQKEYSWILTDTTEFQKLVEADPNFAREFSRLDKFWNQMSKAFHGARDKGVYREEGGADVIDADFTEII